MKVIIVTPASRRSRKGNRITAERWARFLRAHWRVQIAEQFCGQACDLLIALHARKSARSIQRYRTAHPNRPLVLLLTGTDVYGDLGPNSVARHSVEVADRLVVLQPKALAELPPRLRRKGRVIYQSAEPLSRAPQPLKSVFEVAVIGHLRTVKDPFRAAMAARHLPAESRIRISHAGAALDETMKQRALREMRRNPRYRWWGELPRGKARRLLARSRLMVLSSRSEGGANVISEAAVSSVPVLASRVAGNVGLLGDDYAGYFPPGDTQALSELLERCETDPQLLNQLTSQITSRADRFRPECEAENLRALVDELG